MQEIWTSLLTLGCAALLGGLVGLERELRGQWAGLRTHMMVSMAAALFTLVVVTYPGASANELSRVIQGVSAGIGFIGAGTILKLTGRLEIRGLTTASSIWLAAAMGCACGVGAFQLAAVAAALALAILLLARMAEYYLPAPFDKTAPPANPEKMHTEGEDSVEAR